MKKLLFALAIATPILSGVATIQAAESNPAIVHRQGIYKIASGHMNAIKSILFLGFNSQQDVAYHAQGIVSAFEHMGNSYPAGSDKGETKAKAKMWQEFEIVKKYGNEAYGAAKALVKAGQGDNKQEMITAFKTLGGKCKQCHDDYKKD
ncbi:MAG: cytochrome c [Magnetococcales bacterium]|nr:cytochrome c [Magnetococcales bacterium]